ncbi:Coiled-coil domain-containing protein 124 [Frankliniella fusca]|uniref:Coiled-coil domain-containing protein 124 n=1 Tax=Frankliniella fusca TaxID=407009 RepID=A0AAE1HA45_9NEOP|nr:Coiled-coil domain-containing protein 124 [Frankliniella fusca]
MPKKFAGENSKAVAARARKDEKKKDEETRKQKAIEDALWKDDDKLINRKNQRKEEQEKKKAEALQKKAEAKALLEQEMSSIKVSTGKQPISKITRQQIQLETEKRAQAAQPIKPELDTHISQPLVENVNRLEVDGEEARTIEEAISVLSVKDSDIDKHPEKRMKAAFSAFEEANMPRIKNENPTLRLSQLKQILRKEWMKSPENPANQRLA